MQDPALDIFPGFAVAGQKAIDKFRDLSADQFRHILGQQNVESRIAEIRSLNSSDAMNLDEEIKSLEEKRDQLMREIFSALTPWQISQLARQEFADAGERAHAVKTSP